MWFTKPKSRPAPETHDPWYMAPMRVEIKEYHSGLFTDQYSWQATAWPPLRPGQEPYTFGTLATSRDEAEKYIRHSIELWREQRAAETAKKALQREADQHIESFIVS